MTLRRSDQGLVEKWMRTNKVKRARKVAHVPGSDDLKVWASRRLGGRSGVPDEDKVAARRERMRRQRHDEMVQHEEMVRRRDEEIMRGADAQVKLPKARANDRWRVVRDGDGILATEPVGWPNVRRW